MKKQTNLSRPHTGKLSLNKKTISNLNLSEMSKHIGGGTGWACYSNNCTHKGCGGATKNGKTCNGHNTCQYTCV